MMDWGVPPAIVSFMTLFTAAYKDELGIHQLGIYLSVVVVLLCGSTTKITSILMVL
ncbi:MAG: hypothetical protein Q4G13_05695 [Moraxella sp.]|nr:hypothetical protein [Moraxella sp.]